MGIRIATTRSVYASTADGAVEQLWKEPNKKISAPYDLYIAYIYSYIPVAIPCETICVYLGQIRQTDR